MPRQSTTIACRSWKIRNERPPIGGGSEGCRTTRSPEKSDAGSKSSKGSRNGGATEAPKRAICLAGGGPAAGLHIGVLQGLKNHGVDFNNSDAVWALSCIGAWVGIVYNQATGDKEAATYNFFREIFRDDNSFKSFPTNTIFAPDWFGNAEALMNFMLDPQNYKNAFAPRAMMNSFLATLSCLADRDKWGKLSEGDFNRWTLNHVMAVHPAMRFVMAMLYKSAITGRTKLYYPESQFLTDIKFDALNDPDKPYIFHNAWNLTRQKLELFSNRESGEEHVSSHHPGKPVCLFGATSHRANRNDRRRYLL